MSVHSLEVDVQTARALLDSSTPPRLIDCREADEFALCQIAGAELLPLSGFAENFRLKLRDPAQSILIYCHHGMRSLRAAESLTALGYLNVRSLRGGIEAWAVETEPGMARY